MGKIIEFTVEVKEILLGGTKAKSYSAKSVDRLLNTMSKSVKKKWETISFTDNNGSKIILDRSYLYNR